MNTQKEVKVLPNPDGVWITKDTLLTRQSCVKECIGCQKQFDTGSDEVCIPYADPKVMWRRYTVESETIKENSYEYHLNPCPMATHIKHSPKVIGTKGFVLNPIKASKRS
jgi:hypothetical protein